MIPLMTGEDALRRLFASLTEHTFQVDLGVADPALTDYLTEMLVRFTRSETIFRFRDHEGRRLEQVADMLEEADHRAAKPRRELHRHIGDFTLFWSGVFPEALSRLRAPDRKDHLIDYDRTGRQSYHIASTYDVGPFEEEAPVLERLSRDYDLCRAGLRKIREEWDHLPAETLARYQDQSN